MERRAFLGSIACGGAIAVAGCLGPDRDLDPPVVTDARIEDDWREVERSRGVAFDRSFGPIGISAREHTIVYEYVPLAAVVDEFTDGVDGPAGGLFASRLDVSPSVDGLPLGRSQLLSRVDRRGNEAFERELRRNDVEGIERTGTDPFRSDTGHDGTLTSYRGSVPVPEGEYTLGDMRLSLDLGALDVEARFASWHDGTDVLLAGCIFPANSIEDVIEGALPGFLSTDLDLDVGYEPADFEDEVTALLRSIE